MAPILPNLGFQKKENHEPKNAKDLIIENLKDKSRVKFDIYNNTLQTFKLLKRVLKDLTVEYNEELAKIDSRLLLEFRNRSKFEAELRVASDLLIFNMHTNVFEFDKDHSVWKISYVQNNQMSSFAGIINIYNFLADSFKYNRNEDLGYLIGRIFVNKDRHYFIEGKRQLGFLYNDFGNACIDKETLKNIVNSAILYCLNFDLLVPPYDSVKISNVAQMQERFNISQGQTGKRLGFKFYADDDTTE